MRQPAAAKPMAASRSSTCRRPIPDEAQDLAALKGQVDAFDDLVPFVVAEILDTQPLDLDERLAFFADGSLVVHFSSRSPLVLWRNQSTTKFTATVSKRDRTPPEAAA